MLYNCIIKVDINPLNAELNPICHLLALLGGATIVVVSRLRVKEVEWKGVQWIDWAQVGDKYSALMSTVINIQVSVKCGEFRE